jgi:hypothetical protein
VTALAPGWPTIGERPPPRIGEQLAFPRIESIAVVIPVNDEEALLARCLASVHAALAHPRVRPLRSCVVVVLDECRDRSAGVAHALRRAGDEVVVIAARNVGIARGVGSAAGLELLASDPSTTWLAHTDADTTVPRHWLARHVATSARADAVAGIVRVPDWSARTDRARRTFRRHYRTSPMRPHPHVHGANLGVRASAYLAVGGFPPLACAEDHALWNGLAAAGYVTRPSRRVWVDTSARRSARAPGGFAHALDGLDG